MELSRRQIDFLHYPSLSEEFPMISQSLEPLPSLPATFYILNIPYRLKCSVLEKVNPDTFAKISRSSKLMLDDCKYLKKKPIVTVRSLYVKRKESRGFISHGSENESIQWEEIADCGYRVTIGTFGIETSRPDRVREALTILRQALSVERLDFRNGFQDIPVNDVRQLIKASVAEKVMFLDNLRTFRFAELAVTNQRITYILQCGYGFTDEDFLSHNASLEIYYGALTSPRAIITKIKQWSLTAVVGQHFFLSRHASFEETLALDIPVKVGATLRNAPSIAIDFKESREEKMQYEIIWDNMRKLIIELKGTPFCSEICCIVINID